MPDAPSPGAISYLCNGRFLCPACQIVCQVVWEPGAEIRCGRCNGPVRPASGDER